MQYGPVTALRDVSFTVKKGEVVGFLGPNGAGKTSTLRILCGLMPATSGVAKVCGVSLARDPHGARKHIGYMPENNPLPEDMRVVEYLRLRGRLKNLSGRDLRRRVDEVMELCDLRRKMRRKLIGSLSKGYRQRVGIADAILAKPDVAILDEPTIGLDPHQVLTIRRLLTQLRGQMSIVISSHILPEIELSCDRVIIMNNGRVVAIGTPKALREEFIEERSYQMEVLGDVKSLIEELGRQFPHMTLVEQEPALEEGVHKLEARTKERADLSEELLKALSSMQGLRIRSLSRREPTLEDVFLAATVRNWDAPIAGDKRR
ncbi:MAG: ABC transporter ATP-binding protein [Opitutales bacterium]|nr:ABC transporter ATP-binding protein [Opitutales bacterium]